MVPEGGVVNDRAGELRYLDYLRDCVEADNAASQFRVLGSKDTILVERGSAPLGPGSCAVPAVNHAQTWLRARNAAGSNEMLWSGWPVVRGRRKLRGTWSDVAAGMLVTEVLLQRDGDRRVLSPASQAIELDLAALDLLGVGLAEREGLASEFDSRMRSGTVDSLADAVGFLREHGLLDSSLDASELAKFENRSPVSNSAIVWAGDADKSMMTQVLVKDLDTMRGRPVDELRSGPLGVLFGAIESTSATALYPTPTPLPTTLEQERAVCSAMSATLTVVTGPPGTGKSQVLANAVVAALARGETVLLASKNNHAIDVVSERIDSIHAEGAPLRAGSTKYRPAVAAAMGRALSRQQPVVTGLTDAEAAWTRVRADVEKPYEQLAERQELEQQLERARANVRAAEDAVPVGVDVDPLLLDEDLLATSLAAARRRAEEYEVVPNRWFWQKRRKRAAEAALDESIQTVASLMGRSAHDEAVRLLGAGGHQPVLELGSAVVALLTRLKVQSAVEQQLRLLPDVYEADQAISRSLDVRRAPASELYASVWRDRLRTAAPRRKAAEQYRADLQSRLNSGIGPLKTQVPAVLDTFPVWSLTSLTAGSWFPAKRELFDLVVVDEASQSDIASAVPLLYRAKRAMIVGDPAQLTHICGVTASVDERLARKHRIGGAIHDRLAYSTTSLFGAAAGAVYTAPIFLNRHFRSHPDVIGFSNETFYDGRLHLETDPAHFLAGAAFRWVDFVGTHEPGPGGRSMKNPPEAEKVLDILSMMIDEFEGTGRTIGVVTPFAPQRELLIELVGSRHPDLTITVDTAHGFQGDERDVMIVSLAVTEGCTPGQVRFAANANLLNVALTRARGRTIIVGDKRFASSSETLLSQLAAYAERVGTR